MDTLAESIELSEYSLDHDPLARSGAVHPQPPSLRDNSGWVERLLRAAARHFSLDDLTMPAGLAADLPEMFSAGDGGIWVAVTKNGAGGRVAALGPGPGPTTTYGLAVDIGSTTLVMALVDLDGPRVKDRLTLANPQVAYGEDILTRAHFAERGDGLSTLVSALREGINRGIDTLCAREGVSPERLAAGVMSGNTAMTHYLLGLPLKTLIREPYAPVVNRPAGLMAGDVGLNLAPHAPVLVMPNKGSYFGGDLMSGLLFSGMARAEEPCLLVDVGTNAEVVLGQKDWLVGAAGAAGPALEGGVAARGMVAGPGAIDQVRIDRETKEIRWRSIDGRPPGGICGSGLIDLFAELFLSGLIDFQGKITLARGDPRRMETDEGPAIVVVPGADTADGEPILLSEVELDILTRSKAGMYTILSTVVKSVGFTFDQVRRFYVAGTFGQYIDPRMAVAVGMMPDIPLERFVPLGNSSLQGAVLALVSSRARAEVDDIWKRLTYLEMNVNQELMNRFSAARFIPHTNRELFPSVGRTII